MDVTISCAMRALYYKDIFKPISDDNYKYGTCSFSGSRSNVVREMVEFIDVLNTKNLKDDVFEFHVNVIVPTHKDWHICVYKCYNPFRDFIVQLKHQHAQETTHSVNMRMDASGMVSLHKYGGMCIPDDSIIEWGIDVLRELTYTQRKYIH
jgi:hypothetical protein